MIKDIMAVKAGSDAVINFNAIGTILIVPIPFAIVSEFIVDYPDFWKIVRLHRDRHSESQ